TDQDADPNNTVPAAGTRGTGCDGQTNPAGHWRSDATHPALASVGFWEYTQFISVTDPPVFFIPQTDLSVPFCTDDPINCTGPVSMEVLIEECSYVPVEPILLTYDENGDGSPDAVLELLLDGTFNTLLGPGLVTPSLIYPVWTIDLPTVPVGDHSIELQGGNFCNTGNSIDLDFSVVECDFSNLVCLSAVAIQLQAVNPPTDLDGDGNVDVAALEVTPDMFLLQEPIGCSEPVAYSINLVGSTPDINQSSLWLPCDELGFAQLEIHVWNAFGSSDFCEASANVQDPGAFCPDGPRPGPPEAIHLYPNPATEELLIEATRYGQAELSILGLGSQFAIQGRANVGRQPIRQDISQLPPGLYTLRLRYPDGTLLYQRFVKM
ncbi:MAG: T9SS type A sorting domain-containing protein, partial [Lewinella sp.]|nr:T9SS type A sorting domain-containing protein [Lewinella sp.]